MEWSRALCICFKKLYTLQLYSVEQTLDFLKYEGTFQFPLLA